jgi:hypothetical protein
MKYFFTIQKNLEYESKITYEEIIVLREARQNETTKRIEQIANQTKAQINKLKIKFETEDRIKFISALVAFVFLSLLIGFVLLIDFINCLKYLNRKDKQPKKNMTKKERVNMRTNSDWDHRPVGRDRIRSRPKNLKNGRDPDKKFGRDRVRVAIQIKNPVATDHGSRPT